jgi:molybdopterin-guanine dinucleotide biosynthesis protein B
MNVIQIVGYKNSGKTTLISRLVRALTAKGFHVGTIKHDAHDFDIDYPGKDTWQHREAGAETVAITSTKKTAMIEQRLIPPADLLKRMEHVDLVLIEGFKSEPYPKIVIIKEEENTKLLEMSENVIGAASWIPLKNMGVPVWHIDQTEGLLHFLLDQIKK